MSRNTEQNAGQTGISSRNGEPEKDQEKLSGPGRSSAKSDWQQLRDAVQRLGQQRQAQ